MHAYFSHPWLLASLALLPMLWVASALAASRRARLLAAMAGPLTGGALARSRPGRLRQSCWGLGLILLAVGAAGPRWGRDWSQSAARGRDLIVVVDCSRSMFAEAPSRLERTREALLSLADALRRRGGHRLALVTFAGTARLDCPPTHDLDHFRECVAAIDALVPDSTLGQGTRIGAGLTLAVESFAGRTRSARDILLLSDGDDPARDGEYRSGIALARSEGVPVHVAGVGDPGEPRRIPDGPGWLKYEGRDVTTRLEDAPLREIARRTGGRLLLPGARPFDLGEFYREISAGGAAEDSPDALPVLRQRQQWFLLPALALLGVALLFPGRGAKS
jgi:Ca-activated chloride channel family protein